MVETYLTVVHFSWAVPRYQQHLSWGADKHHGLQFRQFESYGFLPTEASKYACARRCSWKTRSTSTSPSEYLSDYQKLPWHLWTDAAVRDDTCRGVHWISWGTLRAPAIKVFWHDTSKMFPENFYMDVSLLFWYVEFEPQMFPQLSVTPYVLKMICNGRIILMSKHKT
jgi:hypothetical protein